MDYGKYKDVVLARKLNISVEEAKKLKTGVQSVIIPIVEKYAEQVKDDVFGKNEITEIESEEPDGGFTDNS